MKSYHYEVEAKVTHIEFLVELHMLLHKGSSLISAKQENIQKLFDTLDSLTSVKSFTQSRADELDQYAEKTSRDMNDGDIDPDQAFNLIRARVKEANENVSDVLSVALEEYSDTYIEISESGDKLLEFLPKPKAVIDMLSQTYHFKLTAILEKEELNLDLFAKAS